MTTEKTALSLPSVVGDETIISLQKAVTVARKDAVDVEGLFTRREIPKGDLLYEVGSVPNAIYMLRGGTIRLKAPTSRPVEEMPVTTLYHAAPGKGVNRPLLGARYFFNRTPCTLEYVAETACTVYEITSGALSDLHDADRQAVILMMYWLVASSDLSDLYIPSLNKALGLEKADVGNTIGLLNAIEEFRAARNDPRMPGLLYKLYKSIVNRRIARAADLGLEPSVVPLAPRMDRTS